jgi:DNA-binding NarL/FixJ family response regulator
MIKCLLVEDQTLVRLGLKSLLELDKTITISAMAEDGEMCISYLNEQSFDVVLLDMRMPNLDGLGVLTYLNKQGIKLPVLIITTFEDCDVLAKAMQLGAMGYILKNAELETLITAIKSVYQGHQVLQPALTQFLLQKQHSQFDALTKKEHEVLKCLALGMANKTIASTLNNSDGTIRNHVSQILEKLGVTDRTQAVIKAINEGII